ncbi:DEAD/DEAH box helicase [Candidatus Marsarchaeota archaeon]|jgi:helicase|nr:DEAD/DEAH box helicase [Candidatus Marsarchaeota archaeon]
MELSSLKGKISNEIIESLAGRGFNAFTPPQELAIAAGLLDGKNIIVAAPTASGKTLIGELAAMRSILMEGKKAVYIAPMRALVTEKFEELKLAYPYLKSAISMGDLDSGDQWLSEYDMLFVSTEKMDSLIRHGAGWLSSVGCVIFDEVHMMGDLSRGPTLELLITKLMMITDAQIIALSATIGNSDELAEWLGAKLVISDFRPVKLMKGIVSDGIAHYYDEGKETKVSLSGSSQIPEIRVLQDTLKMKKQMLAFYSTKRNAEAGAVKLSQNTERALSQEEKSKLDKIGGNILNVLEKPTAQCIKLSDLVKKGIAFHHSGLLNAQRNYIENAFKDNLIKAICATTTLGLGVNLPAHTVLVRDISRHNGINSERLGANEIMQLFGRAGRPRYDTEGRALLTAPSHYSVDELYNRYIKAGPEPIDSGLGVAPVLRMHVLSFIAEGFLGNEREIMEFLSKTFYGYQYGSNAHIKNVVSSVLRDLVDWDFIIRSDSGYDATKLGKRVSELYIDPMSAKWILDSLSYADDALSTLYMVSNTVEMRPYVKPTEEAEAEFVRYKTMSSAIYENESMDYGYYDPVSAFSTALMLGEWINEADENSIVKKYRTTPGVLYIKLSNADWLIYSAIEIAKIMHKSIHRLVDTRVRIRYGIKEELLDLVRLEQIGRVRARRLYGNGIKSVQDIRANVEIVRSVLGSEVAKKVFMQLGIA